jgi:hypothetical protein
MTRLRDFLERMVTKQDYFHQPHRAEDDFSDATRSYYYDVRARAAYPGPFEGALPTIDYGGLRFTNPIHAAQYGLAHLQHFWDTQDPAWLAKAHRVALELVELGTPEGACLVWRYPLTLRGVRHWPSAMAQGQVASFLLRVATLTEDSHLREAAKASLATFQQDISSGGVRTSLNGHVWFEEYAIDPAPYTLNGFIVALLGVHDACCLLEPQGDSYPSLYHEGVTTLKAVLPRFDTRGWSRYDLSARTVLGVPLRNLASPFYHRFHLELLAIMARLTGESAFDEMRQRWQRTLVQGSTFYLATTEKVLYRALTPNPHASATSKPSTVGI